MPPKSKKKSAKLKKAAEEPTAPWGSDLEDVEPVVELEAEAELKETERISKEVELKDKMDSEKRFEAEAKISEAPSQMTMTLVRCSKDGLEVRKRCGNHEIVAKEVSVSIGGHVYLGDVKAGATGPNIKRWAFSADGVKLVYEKPGPRCCGFCKQDKLLNVFKGGQLAGTLAWPSKTEKKQGVLRKVLNADGTMVYAMRKEVFKPDLKPALGPVPPPPPRGRCCEISAEWYCCCFIARCSKLDGCSWAKVCWPSAGLGCCHVFANSCSLEGHDTAICGHRCFSCIRNSKECHCIFCMNGPSTYQRDEEGQLSCQTHCCLYHRFCESRKDCCLPQPAPQQVPSPPFKEWKKNNFWGGLEKCGAYFGMDLGIEVVSFLIGSAAVQLVCCCFDVRLSDTDPSSCSKIPCKPIGVVGCCPKPWFDMADLEPFCCYYGMQCCSDIYENWLSPAKSQLMCCCFDARLDQANVNSCRKMPWKCLGVIGCCAFFDWETDLPSEFCCGGGLQCCSKFYGKLFQCCKKPPPEDPDELKRSSLPIGIWHTPLPEEFAEVSHVDPKGVYTRKAPQIMKETVAKFATKQSDENLLAFSTATMWEMVKERDDATTTKGKPSKGFKFLGSSAFLNPKK